MRRAVLLLALLGLASLAHAQAQAPAPHVEASLTLNSWLYALPAPQEGGGVRAEVAFKVEKGWHLYWRNPGDAGRPIDVAWHLPPGWTAGPLQWPVPKLFSSAGLTDYGYEGEVLLYAFLKPPVLGAKLAKLDPSRVSADVSWLVCSAEACVPGRVSLLPAPEASGTRIYRDDGAVFPKSLPKGEATLDADADDDFLRLSLSDASDVALLPQTGALRFIPYGKGIVANGERQFAIRSAQGIELRMKRSPLAKDQPPLSGTVAGLLLAVDAGTGWEVSAKVVPPHAPPAPPPGFPFAALGLALLGGLLLNLMPCVLPVLSLKVLALVSMPRREGLRHGLAYTAGVVLSFLALAGLLLALRAAGGRFGWGFQLQSPPFVVFIAALFFAITLNLLGLFEIGEGLAARGGAVLEETKKSILAPFLGGLLAVVVATPCTAPFMGTALGVAFTQPAFVALLIFAALGLGLAAPYLALAANPAWLRFVPKSGGWMVWFRRVLAIPMAATVAWLVWVYYRETGSGGLALLLMSLVVMFFAAIIFRQWNGPLRLLVRALALVTVGATVSVPMVYKGHLPVQAEDEEGDWIPFSEERLASFQEAGRPVFIDFTADWCLPCQVNKRVLDSPEVAATFREKGVVRLLADWTRNDPEVTSALARAGRQSVPLYLLYGSDVSAPPRILPAVLTRQTVLDALDTVK